ncbi:thioredoxin family protein [Cochleicola gelatinilyticus]|uniref:Thioredoxin n=1 Tax=Cochleicola gelatinilyticus TaxID=1763537 RepID=A0A167GWJ1_9FLAO|nr:thioredoxin family protein [Cochleicola gelatinilyticus]OAB77976.1 hypothetical protein ULVI_10835 [Cochleicola gelatinilyticus]
MNFRLLLLCCIFLCISNVQAQETTETLLTEAYAKAQAENKNVFVKFEASWCGWCKRMQTQMKDSELAPLFDANYVIVTLVTKETKRLKGLENPGAFELLEKHKGVKAGLPFWLIFDAKGNLIGDSLDAEGNNLGCPSAVNEVSVFLETLQKTSNLSETELQMIGETFRSE